MVKKSAQQSDVNNLDLGELLLPLNLLSPLSNAPPIEIEDDIEVSSDEEPEEFVFILDNIPGAPDAEDIEIDDEDVSVEVEENPEDTDVWKWSHSTFLPWLSKMFKNIPRHSGYDTTGLEKAISYFETIDREISKAMRSDFKDEINSVQAERAREQIEEGLERLIDRLNDVRQKKYKRYSKKSKSWAESTGIIKEAKSTRINGITITVPLLISRIARVCINGMVSAGHDIEDMYQRQVDEYKLDKREQAELAQLLEDMGYNLRTDRGYPVGTPVQEWKSDNFDWAANYK